MGGWQVLGSNSFVFCLLILQVLEGSCSTPQFQPPPSPCFQQNLLSTSFSAAFLQGQNANPGIICPRKSLCNLPLHTRNHRTRAPVVCAAGPGEGVRAEDIRPPHVEPKAGRDGQHSASDGYLNSLSHKPLYHDPPESIPVAQLAMEMDGAAAPVSPSPAIEAEVSTAGVGGEAASTAAVGSGEAALNRAQGRAKKRAEFKRGSGTLLRAVINGTKSLASATSTLRKNVQELMVGHRLEVSVESSKAKQRNVTLPAGSALEDLLLEDERAMEGIVSGTIERRGSEDSQSYLQSLESSKAMLRTPAFLTRYSEDYWTQNLFTVFRSRTFKRIAPSLLVNFFVAVSVAICFHFFPGVVPGLSGVSGFAHQITGSFLALLITFRTDVGYKRFWEGRKIWGVVHKRCRSLARLLGSTSAHRHPEMVSRCFGLIKAYTYCLKQQLRSQRKMDEIEAFLDKEDLESVARSDNMALHVCMLISFSIRPLLLDPRIGSDMQVWEQADFHVEELVRCVGNAEQIVNTPVPLSYSRHTRRFLFLWTITLPLFLINACGPIPSIIAHLFICWALLGTEQVGHLIEDPFGYTVPRSRGPLATTAKKEYSENLPLHRFCVAIKKDVEEVESICAPGSVMQMQRPLPQA